MAFRALTGRLKPGTPFHMNKSFIVHRSSFTERGFTLIELLVVIGIIAVLVAFSVTNFVGVRSRAKDVKKKAELTQMKSALRLYYNDYATYPGPASTSQNTFNGCGTATPPVSNCLTTCSGAFATGAGCTGVIYMKLLPPASDYTWNYRQVASGDNFCLWATLENTSDGEGATSRARCNAFCSSYVTSSDYVICAD